MKFQMDKATSIVDPKPKRLEFIGGVVSKVGASGLALQQSGNFSVEVAFRAVLFRFRDDGTAVTLNLDICPPFLILAWSKSFPGG
jgi:hypothetical protein